MSIQMLGFLDRIWIQQTVTQSSTRALPMRFKIEFHPSWSCGDAVPRGFPTAGENQAGMRNDLQIFTSNSSPSIQVQAIHSTRSWIDLRPDSHPANHLCWVGEKLEDHSRRRLDKDFLDYWFAGQDPSELALSRVFRRFTGTTPGAFRRAHTSRQ
jgi:hypothetical protein